MIEVRNLNQSYGARRVLHDVTVHFPARQQQVGGRVAAGHGALHLAPLAQRLQKGNAPATSSSPGRNTAASNSNPPVQPPFVENQQLVGLGQRGRTVSHQHHGAALSLEVSNGPVVPRPRIEDRQGLEN